MSKKEYKRVYDNAVFYKYNKPGFYIYHIDVYERFDNGIQLIDSWDFETNKFIGFSVEKQIKSNYSKSIYLVAAPPEFIENN